MNISAAGSNVWQTGRAGAEYALSPGNSQIPNGGATAPDLPTDSEGNEIIFPNTSVGRQLQQIARAIMGRNTMGAVRQTFFVQRGGWDHHSDVLSLQTSMLAEIDDALDAFYRQLQALGINDKVTTFSASDFGRTLTSNGRGSDHAWGGNHFVLGGSVQGQQIFGTYPSLALNGASELNPLETGRGRLIPTTSCDTFFAELALWLGVPEGSLPLVLPNVRNFYTGGGSPLGFMA